MKSEVRTKPDGSVLHQLSVPSNLRLGEEVRLQLHKMEAEYLAVQRREVPGLLEGMLGSVAQGVSMFGYLFGRLEDAWSGQHSDSLQRAHDSRRYMKKWEPTYLAIQAELVAIQDRRDALLRELSESLRMIDSYDARSEAMNIESWLLSQ